MTYNLTLEQITAIVKHLQGDCEIRTPCAKYCLNSFTSDNCDTAISKAIVDFMEKDKHFKGVNVK